MSSTTLREQSAGTSAHRQATENARRNLAALGATQPEIARLLEAQPVDIDEWIYARDGALTGMLAGERWWAGCSVPRLAARAMLKSLDPKGAVSCFLAPPHPAHVRVALDMQTPDQALIVILPEEQAARVMIRCEDFSREIEANRLWLVCGDAWESQLDALLSERPGLSIPAQFVRVIALGEEVIGKLVTGAQKIFSHQTSQRAARIEQLRTAFRPRPTGRVCVMTRSHFRLWDDAASELARAMGSDADAVLTIDLDNPLTTSTLAFAQAASECDAVITADIARSDLPGVLPDDLPVITWVTTGRIPTPHHRDGLVLADASWVSDAAKLGWSASRIVVGGRPARSIHISGQGIAMIAETIEVGAAPKEMEYSSHALLWDLIRNELAKEPLAVREDVSAYLTSRMRRAGITEEGFDRRLFVDRLIVPAYQQGVARLLIGAGVPLRLHGKGWRDLAEFRSHASGEIRSREQLHAAIDASAAIVHCWPLARCAHPMESMGRPVIRCGSEARALLREVKAALIGASNGTNRMSSAPCISRDLIVALLH